MDPEILIPIAGMMTGGMMFVAIGLTIRHWVDRHYDHKRRLSAGGDARDLAHLADRLEAVEEEMVRRMMDLEERMDFTERVLTRGRDQGGANDAEDA